MESWSRANPPLSLVQYSLGRILGAQLVSVAGVVVAAECAFPPLWGMVPPTHIQNSSFFIHVITELRTKHGLKTKLQQMTGDEDDDKLLTMNTSQEAVSDALDELAPKNYGDYNGDEAAVFEANEVVYARGGDVFRRFVRRVAWATWFDMCRDTLFQFFISLGMCTIVDAVPALRAAVVTSAGLDSAVQLWSMQRSFGFHFIETFWRKFFFPIKLLHTIQHSPPIAANDVFAMQNAMCPETATVLFMTEIVSDTLMMGLKGGASSNNVSLWRILYNLRRLPKESEVRKRHTKTMLNRLLFSVVSIVGQVAVTFAVSKNFAQHNRTLPFVFDPRRGSAYVGAYIAQAAARAFFNMYVSRKLFRNELQRVVVEAKKSMK
eukprot:PhM_4_TR9172/c0_g1_i1/m.42155